MVALSLEMAAKSDLFSQEVINIEDAPEQGMFRFCGLTFASSPLRLTHLER